MSLIGSFEFYKCRLIGTLERISGTRKCPVNFYAKNRDLATKNGV